MSTHQEFCVQYRCPPGMMEWQVWQGSLRHALKWAQVELKNRREEEFDPSIEYRVAVRTVSEWTEAWGKPDLPNAPTKG